MAKPKSSQISQFRQEIKTWYHDDGLTQDQIRKKLLVDHGITASQRTLQRKLDEWGFNKNQPVTEDMEAEIQELFRIGLKHQQIIEHIQRERPGVNVSLRSLQRRLRQWGMSRHNKAGRNPELLELVRHYFFVERLKDEEILTRLKSHGADISPVELARLRIKNGMKRRLRPGIDANDDYDPSEGHLQTVAPANLQLPVNKKINRRVYNRRHYEAIEQRERGTIAARIRRKTRSMVAGPNYMWCIDRYHIFRTFGIEIHAGIDAYSRRIMWISMGRSNSQPTNITRHFLETVISLGFRPWFTRTDGAETPLLSHTQHQLAMGTKPQVAASFPDGVVYDLKQGDHMTECHIYDQSAGDGKTGQWWRQLRAETADHWISYFQWLTRVGAFIEGFLPDQVALYAIYVPLIQQELNEFVEQWNNHHIKYQRNEGDAIDGRVNALWETTDVQNFGVSITVDAYMIELTHQLLEPLSLYDPSGFLSPETQQLCNHWLEENSILNIQFDKAHPHLHKYLALKDYLTEYENEGREPKLTLNEIPP
ncbi:hypothetical protein M426DRAFT_316179 [Hypoxylon sp. CI-4A]|nr:hypothetical protein M426DRAFT_316179 [Hypoxylon sp. CI-4A]